MIDLMGKQALVCGSSRGIGQACAEALARCGCGVTVLARSSDALEQVRQALPSDRGQSHHALVADTRHPDQLAEVVQNHVQKIGTIEILVNNSGGPAPGPILSADDDDFQTALRSHLLANHALVRTLIPGMRDAHYGRIINIVSISVKAPIPGLGVSNTTRWAVASWAKTLAGEVGRDGITVNNVLPGYTGTARLNDLLQRKADEDGVSVDELKQRWHATIPLQRFAEPAEIGNAVAFLASPLASYVTGINLPVDGGLLQNL
jgi:3-oxoacyl-[acyl-carrier protein] reductase